VLDRPQGVTGTLQQGSGRAASAWAAYISEIPGDGPSRPAAFYVYAPNRLANAMPALPGARPPFPTENTSTGVVRSRTALSGPDKVAAIAQVNHLERLLFDDEGRLRRRTNPELADELLGAVNNLRRQLGWLCLDMAHHQCWSEDVPARPGR
jgi:hypothetical protein